jgi:hypothetical protein
MIHRSVGIEIIFAKIKTEEMLHLHHSVKEVKAERIFLLHVLTQLLPHALDGCALAP